MMPNLRRLSLLLALAALCVVSSAFAQSRSLTSGPVVRRQLLFRSDRLEIAPTLGAQIAPVFQRPVFLSGAVRYHLTNAFSLGASLNLAPVQLGTSVSRNFDDLNRDQLPSDQAEVEYAHPLVMTDVHLSYVPVHGKINLLGAHLVHWDLFLTAGVGGALVLSDADELAGFKFGPALGVGLRTFVRDKMAVTVLFQDYLYSGADAQRFCCGVSPTPTPVDDRFRNHVIGGAGVSFFFPSEVRVSR